MFFRAIAAAAVAVGFVVAALPFASPPAPLLPPSARAYDPDGGFIAALIDHGAQVTDSNTAVHTAHWVCGFLSNGFTRREVAGAVRPKMRYTEAQAATFVDLSIGYYCPEFLA